MLRFAKKMQIVFLRINEPSGDLGFNQLANSVLIMMCETIFIESFCTQYYSNNFYIQ